MEEFKVKVEHSVITYALLTLTFHLLLAQLIKTCHADKFNASLCIFDLNLRMSSSFYGIWNTPDEIFTGMEFGTHRVPGGDFQTWKVGNHWLQVEDIHRFLESKLFSRRESLVL